MKFFKPQVQLARETILDEPDAYYLHVVTFCPRSNFRANGHSVSAVELAQGIYTVTINLLQDTELPEFDYITPVVHTLALGSIPFPGGEGWIEVQVMGAVPDASTAGTRGGPTTTTKTGGKGTVSTTDADNKSKPIRNDEL